MSRHQLTPLPDQPPIEVIVGWDRPLRTFYIQVHRDPATDDEQDGDDDAPFVWEGTSPDQITNALDVITIASRYAEVTPDLYHALCADSAREGARVVPGPGDHLAREIAQEIENT